MFEIEDFDTAHEMNYWNVMFPDTDNWSAFQSYEWWRFNILCEMDLQFEL